VTRKNSNAPKVTRHRGSSADDPSKKVALFKRERDEARERETATANILGVIASSPDSTQPVFEAIVNSGLKLFPGATISIAVPVADQVTAAAVAQRACRIVARHFSVPADARLHARPCHS
jgi:hypothetical protein